MSFSCWNKVSPKHVMASVQSKEKDLRLRTNRRLNPGIELPVSFLDLSNTCLHLTLIDCQPPEQDSVDISKRLPDRAQPPFPLMGSLSKVGSLISYQDVTLNNTLVSIYTRVLFVTTTDTTLNLLSYVTLTNTHLYSI